MLKPFFTLLDFLSRSTKYTIYTKQQNIKKVPTYSPTRWTSFCRTILTFIQTKDKLIDFCSIYTIETPSEEDWEKLEQLNDLCTEYVRIMNFFESDSFGASGFFLCYIDILIDKFNSLNHTDFEIPANDAKSKINKYKEKHSLFWTVISPMALLLNPSIPFDQLLSKKDIQKAKASILSRMANYLPHDRHEKDQAQHPAFMDKYYSRNSKEKKHLLKKY